MNSTYYCHFKLYFSGITSTAQPRREGGPGRLQQAPAAAAGALPRRAGTGTRLALQGARSAPGTAKTVPPRPEQQLKARWSGPYFPEQQPQKLPTTLGAALGPGAPSVPPDPGQSPNPPTSTTHRAHRPVTRPAPPPPPCPGAAQSGTEPGNYPGPRRRFSPAGASEPVLGPATRSAAPCRAPPAGGQVLFSTRPQRAVPGLPRCVRPRPTPEPGRAEYERRASEQGMTQSCRRSPPAVTSLSAPQIFPPPRVGTTHGILRQGHPQGATGQTVLGMGLCCRKAAWGRDEMRVLSTVSCWRERCSRFPVFPSLVLRPGTQTPPPPPHPDASPRARGTTHTVTETQPLLGQVHVGVGSCDEVTLGFFGLWLRPSTCSSLLGFSHCLGIHWPTQLGDAASLPIAVMIMGFGQGGACAVRNTNSLYPLLGTSSGLSVTWTSRCFFLVLQVTVHGNNASTKTCGGTHIALQIHRCH
ncbi:formin-like protein 5 [Falco rusticolus]|uniref:formin-like protein 5 n=1 Tax=Falco rusticolus TaxID=120794 RepID=UPI00188689BF|nr:formin-like protein 5 [Falco rusticolus]